MSETPENATGQVNIPEIRSNNMELYSDQYPFSLPLRITSFENEKTYVAFIKNCEKLIRGSSEFKLWRDYIRDVLHVTTCSITNEIMGEVSISIHHHIPDLFTLVKALINRKLASETPFSTFDICLEAIELHFNNHVGYTPLIESLHEKFHNGYLRIPIEYIRGDYQYFIDNLMSYLDDDDVSKLMDRTAVHIQDVPSYSWSRDDYQVAAGVGS